MKSLLHSLIKGNSTLSRVPHRHCRALQCFRIAVFGSASLVFVLFFAFLLLQWREKRERSIPEKYIAEARSQMEKGNYTAATELCERAIAAKPRNPEALNILGALRAGKGEANESLKSFQRALKTGIGSAATHYNLGNAYLSRGDIHNATRHFEKAAILREDYLLPRIMLTRLYDSAGRRKESTRLYEEILDIEKKRQRRDLFDTTPGLANYGERTALFEAKNTYNRGFILERKGRYQEAIGDYSRVIELQPTFAPAYFRRGVAYLHLADYAQAEEDMKRAVRLDPMTPIMEGALGDVLYRRGRLEEASSIFQDLTKAFPSNTILQDYLGGLFVMQGRFTEAEKVYKTLLELDPECSRAHEGLANVCFNLQHYEEAERRYKKAIALAPDRPDPYYNLACLYCKTGRKEESIQWLSEALKRGFRDTAFIKNDPNLQVLREDGTLSRMNL